MVDAQEVIDDGFAEEVAEELLWAEENHAPLNSYHEAYAVMAEELDEFWEIVRQKAKYRDPQKAKHELIQIAAMAWRTARNLGLLDQ